MVMATSSNAGSTVVIFDFDRTIIDVDSDNWVVDEFGFNDLFNQLLPTLPWNSLMDRMMKEIHSQGRTIQEIKECLKRAPLHPSIIKAIKTAHSLGCDLRIVSDANVLFIETILREYGLFDCFSEIHTNPCFVDEEGRLRILPYHDFTVCSHGCNQPCTPNMCKGLIIERIKKAAVAEGKRRFIYVGDGPGDFCPSQKLGEGDYVMPRKNYPVWDLICNKPFLVKAKIHEWRNGEEFEQVLLSIIHTIITEGNNDSSDTSMVDCLQTDHQVSATHEPSTTIHNPQSTIHNPATASSSLVSFI